jgi:exodeoxyribonuclease VII small subunit
MGAKKVKKTGTPDFEATMAELEDVVRLLEGGDQPLEDALAAFEKGIGLVKALHARLDSVQMRIDELAQGADGKDVLVPLALEDGDEEQ